MRLLRLRLDTPSCCRRCQPTAFRGWRALRRCRAIAAAAALMRAATLLSAAPSPLRRFDFAAPLFRHFAIWLSRHLSAFLHAISPRFRLSLDASHFAAAFAAFHADFRSLKADAAPPFRDVATP